MKHVRPWPEFWHTANCAFSKKERAEYNEWRSRAYLAADAMRDALHRLTMLDESPRASAAYQRLEAIFAVILEAPTMDE